MVLKRFHSTFNVVIAGLCLLLLAGGIVAPRYAQAAGVSGGIEQYQTPEGTDLEPSGASPAAQPVVRLVFDGVQHMHGAVVHASSTAVLKHAPEAAPIVPEQDPPPRPPADPPSPPPQSEPPEPSGPPEQPDRPAPRPNVPGLPPVSGGGGGGSPNGDPQIVPAMERLETQVGELVVLHFVVSNSGGRSDAVQVETDLPPFLELVRGTTSWGQFYPIFDDNAVVVSIGPLYDGDVVNIHIVARVVAPAVPPEHGVVVSLFTESGSDDPSNNVAQMVVVAPTAGTPAPTTSTPAAPAPDLAVAEGGDGAPLPVVLGSQPAADVQVEFLTDDQLAPISPTVFTAETWNIAQTRMVTALDDAVDEGTHMSTIAYRISSDDPAFDGLEVPGTIVALADNDKGVVRFRIETTPDPAWTGDTVVWSGVTLIEGAPGKSIELVLGSQPAADVTVEVQTDSQLAPVAPLTFTPANWNVPQPVTFDVGDDAFFEGIHAGVVAYTVRSDDPAFDGALLPRMSVTLLDDSRPQMQRVIAP